MPEPEPMPEPVESASTPATRPPKPTPEPVAPVPDYEPSWSGSPEDPIFEGSGSGKAKSSKNHKAHKAKSVKSWKSKAAKSSKGMLAWWNANDDGVVKVVSFNKDGSRGGDVSVESGARGPRSLGRICASATLIVWALALI
mmetsp:Transcript_23420/g.53076  ORF Transcript_23420/g.53076 Transcript_23420/m.53076 type:complete len:141 (-) Transcript_23420:238-660(-)